MKLEYTSYDDKLAFRVSVQNAESIKINGEEVPSLEETAWVWDGEYTPSSPAGPMEWDWFGWVCAKCREFPTDDDWDNPEEPPKMEYCPHCGRKVNKVVEKKFIPTSSDIPVLMGIERDAEQDSEKRSIDELIWD